MKAKSIRLSLFLSLLLIYHINSLSNTVHEIIHENSQLPKVCTLADKSVLVLSTLRGEQSMKESKFDMKGRALYGNSTYGLGYTASSQLVELHSVNGSEPNYLLSYHNKEGLKDSVSKEFILEFNHGKSKSTPYLNTIYQQKSTVALKNGKVVLAGLNKKSGYGAQTSVDLKIYDPETATVGEGVSFNAFSDYVSCFELKENDLYCVYSSLEHVYVNKLKIMYISVNGNVLTIVEKGDQVIKSFYTDFNFLKAVPFNENEAIVLFQTGNGKGKPKYGNDGKDLYYYHLVVNKKDISVKRYELLYEDCKRYEDPENYNADIAVLSQKRIYAACETESGRFRGFVIYPDKAEWEEFNFNNFNAEYVENPVFAKFDKSLGIFYGYNTVNENVKVAFHLMNYPDCFNYREKEITVPKKRTVDNIDLTGKVFMNNPYPASRANEEIKVRFESNSNISIVNTEDGKEIEEGKDYVSNVNLKITAGSTDGAYTLKYTATREDNLDGTIIGRSCNININVPKCLDRCESCTKLGNEDHHYCLGCAEGKYYEEEDETTVNEGWGKPHNCPNCNISCSSCFGPALMKPTQTTNCKKCDYENGYYHYEHDERTCISYETQEAWEKYFNRSIYLDSTPGPDKKSEWRWRFCHVRCKKCHLPGTDENNNCDLCDENNGFYFWCNQTEGNGIPGSCHDNCVNNGFFLKPFETMTKCCPCLDHCKVCQNETICDNCYPNYFRIPSGEACPSDCNENSCWAEDRELWECVNCKTRYGKGVEKYNLNKTCVDKIPFIPFLNRDHHIVDEQCNILHGCKEGCFKCAPWYTEECTQCFPEFYKEDFYGLTQPPTFHCYKEKECQGIEKYQFNESERIGGVPKLVQGENVCYNCRLREGNYRQVENDFTCGPRAKRTYIDIPHYNKLGQCHRRCSSCDSWGNDCIFNCTACREPSLYDFKPYTWNTSLGNCERYSHKCKSLPYYHDYDLAEVKGIDEDNCGQECDVCLTNMTCTERFPFFVVATRECVESCPITDILGKTCLMNHTQAGFILLENPFQLEDLYRPINQTVNIQQLISSSIFETVVKQYNLNVTDVKKQINNVLGEGTIYNLPNSQIIIGNNISIELTSVSLELEKLANLLKGSSKSTSQQTITQTSILDISQCEKTLKKKYGLLDEEQLMIIKGDILKELQNYLGTQTEYQLFSTSLGAFLPLTECQEQNQNTTIYNPFNISFLSLDLQNRLGDAINGEYDVFSSDSPFYNDICTPFTNENGNDVLLDERRKDYFNENLNLCTSGCTFNDYNPTSHLYSCVCPIKGSNNTKIETKELDENFYKRHKNSNIEVIKCASKVFSSEGQKKNFGSYILLGCLVSFVGVAVFYFVKGKSKVDQLYGRLSGSSNPANPPKPPTSATSKENAKPSQNPSNLEKDFVLNDYELNAADYDTAKNKDKRSFLQYYWSLIKSKQICIFTFYTSDDYNIKSIKIALFILFVAFYFAFTALFFNDSIMRSIYIYKGNTNAAVHIPNIILSSICSLIMMYIVRFVSLSERDVTKIKYETNNKEELIKKSKKLMKIKAFILFIVSSLLIGLCWYYVAAFCAIFKNSQGHYLTNVLISFIICNIWPFVTSLIAPILRLKALSGNNQCLYKASQIIAYF